VWSDASRGMVVACALRGWGGAREPSEACSCEVAEGATRVVLEGATFWSDAVRRRVLSISPPRSPPGPGPGKLALSHLVTASEEVCRGGGVHEEEGCTGCGVYDTVVQRGG
jgi:hypothetical protein